MGSWERDEWRTAVRAATDDELAAARNATRAALGIIGDAADALDDLAREPDEDE